MTFFPSVINFHYFTLLVNRTLVHYSSVTVSQALSVGARLAYMKINERINQLESSWEARGGTFHAQHQLSIAEPNRKRGTFQVDTTFLSQQKEKLFFSPLATTPLIRDRHRSANEKPLFFELLIYYNKTSNFKSHSTPPFSLQKSIPFFCSSNLLMVLPQLACSGLQFSTITE